MLTPERQARMDIKLRQTPEPMRRTEGVDYRNGYFFVTLVVHDRLPLLGRVYGRYIVENHQVLSVGVHLTSLGEEVQKCWLAIPSFHPDVELIVCHNTYLADSADALQTALDDLRLRLLQHGDSLALDYVGFPDLLTAPRKLPLICHRADAARFSEQAAAVIREAEQGAVIVSAFISPREREILRTLIAAGCPVIEITDNGFGKTYRPHGTSFYACAESRLLQITPWTYHYEKDPSPITRPMCMVMNELARLICAQDEDWWKK